MFPHILLGDLQTNNNEPTHSAPIYTAVYRWLLNSQNQKSSAGKHSHEITYSCIYITDKITQRKYLFYSSLCGDFKFFR